MDTTSLTQSPSTNDHKPRRAILYARVSTRKQAEEDHYSIPQQLHALRDYCQQEGFEIVEEITDPGYSGASLARPGLDRVRDLVEAGGIFVVLAQDADRITRDPGHRAFLDGEFERFGTRLRALDDWGDDTHEGELLKYMKGWVSKGERLKVAERARRGITQKIRQGKPIVTWKAPYGYRLAIDRRLEVYEPEMEVVRRIFSEAANGKSAYRITHELNAEAIPPPALHAKGRKPTSGKWSKKGVWRMLKQDIYVPFSYEEVAAKVSAEVAATLDKQSTYGLWAYGKTASHLWNEPDGNGNYRKRHRVEYRDPDQLLYAPVPDCGLPRAVVEKARANIKNRARRKPSGAARRFWELSGGIARCAECGSVLSPLTAKGTHFYYSCRARYSNVAKECPNHHNNPAAALEQKVWQEVLTLHSEGILTKLVRNAFSKRASALERLTNDLQGRLRLAERLQELTSKRSAYQDQQAAGLLTLDELREKLAVIEDERSTIQGELDAIADADAQLFSLASKRDNFLERIENGFFTIREPSPQERHDLYKQMGLVVEVDRDGEVTISGTVLPPDEFVSVGRGPGSGRP